MEFETMEVEGTAHEQGKGTVKVVLQGSGTHAHMTPPQSLCIKALSVIYNSMNLGQKQEKS